MKEEEQKRKEIYEKSRITRLENKKSKAIMP